MTKTQRDTRSTTWFVRILAAAVMLCWVQVVSAGETITFFHNDVAGSPALATDVNGIQAWKETYRPYGDQLIDSPAAQNNKLWFTGKSFDDSTGLSYMGARYYDPTVGRFMAVDPASFIIDNLHSFNRYNYANNNPYRFFDPDGRNAVTFLGGVLTESWRALGGKGFDGSRLMGALGDGYDGEGSGFAAAAFEDVTSFVPVGTPFKAARAAGNVGRAVETGIQANRAAGKAAEALAAKELVAEGNTILGSQVAARTADGLRIIDHLIQTPAGKIIAVEVKSGNGARNASQLAKDAKMLAEGAVLTGKNAPAELLGKRLIIETIERRYPNK